MKKWVIGLMMGVLALTAYAAWRVSYPQLVKVKTLAIERGPIASTISVTGKLTGPRVVALTSELPGQLAAVLVEEGERVSQGQLLARLEDREMKAQVNRMRAILERSRETIAETQRTLKRLREMRVAGGASPQAVEDAETNWRDAQARTRIAAADLELAEVRLDKHRITAPFDGIVSMRNAEVGQWLEPPTTLFRLVDDSQRVIEAKVDAGDSATVKIGNLVTLSCDAYADREWQAQVTYIAPAVEKAKDESANTFLVKVSMEEEAPPLLYGQQVDLKIRTAYKTDVLKLPYEALLNLQQQAQVAVIENGRVDLVEVVTGIEDLTHTEIVSGLELQQRVILPQGKKLTAGDRVVPDDEK